MNPDVALKHEFVEFIPEECQEGTVYVSIRFATVSHLCVCGCKNKVVTPLRPTDWQLIFDGKTISLYPSIGNWSFPCRSHYWIRKNRVRWAEQWSQARIDAGRTSDRQAKAKYFGTGEPSEVPVEETPATGVPHRPRGRWRTLRDWCRRKR
jgi:Family of unknown function (DUF6527)